jgi:hypothetical protein
MERSPSKSSLAGSPSKRSQPVERSLGNAIKSLSQQAAPTKPFTLTNLGPALTERNGDKTPIVSNFINIMNLATDEVPKFWAAVFAARAGGNPIVCLEEKSGLNYVVPYSDYYPTNVVAHIFIESDRAGGALHVQGFNNSGYSYHGVIQKTGFYEYSAEIPSPRLFTDALKAQLALANYLKIPIDLAKGENIQMAFIPQSYGPNLLILDTKANVFYIVSNTEVRPINSKTKDEYKQLQAAWKALEGFFTICSQQVYHNNDLIFDLTDASLVTDDQKWNTWEIISTKFDPSKNTVFTKDGKLIIVPAGYNPPSVALSPDRRTGENQSLERPHAIKAYESLAAQTMQQIAEMPMKALSRSTSLASLGSSASPDKA